MPLKHNTLAAIVACYEDSRLTAEVLEVKAVELKLLRNYDAKCVQ